ncbi:MAG: hypothetical protein ABFS35_22155, partial [Bacteroidota bacterium]
VAATVVVVAEAITVVVATVAEEVTAGKLQRKIFKRRHLRKLSAFFYNFFYTGRLPYSKYFLFLFLENGE